MNLSRLQRPPGFTYAQSVPNAKAFPLLVDEVPLHKLAKEFGTPLYVYSATAIRERYRDFAGVFGGTQHTVCYSVKANSNLSILRMLAKMGAGFDVVSGGELQRVAAVSKRSVRNVVFSGVGKLAEEIDLALGSGILLFNVESASELELLSARATHLRKLAKFAVRINPDVAARTHPYISTGLSQHKFGVPLREAFELYRRGAENRRLNAAGVSVHIGSQIIDVGPFRESMERTAGLVRQLRNQGHNIRYVDAGGGLGISYQGDNVPDWTRQARLYATALLQPLKKLDVHLLLEPGRWIIGPAGVLVTRVVYRKQNNGKRFLVVDAAMNDLMRPSLYGAHHEIAPLAISNVPGPREKVDIVGPICESGDFFARNREMSRLDEGDLVAILDAGAYGMSLASNYNTRPRPAEMLVEGNRVSLIRKRESVHDMLALERV